MAKIILGLAGELASGKGTVAKYIIGEYQGGAHRFSTILRDILNRLYLEESRDNMQKLSTMLRGTFGENTLAKVIAKDVENDNHKVIAVDGVRRLADIEFLKKLPEFKLIFIEADMEERYERLIKRKENSDDGVKTFEQFKNDHEQEAELQIKDMKNYADIIINNNGDFANLYQQIDNIIGEKNNHASV